MSAGNMLNRAALQPRLVRLIAGPHRPTRLGRRIRVKTDVHAKNLKHLLCRHAATVNQRSGRQAMFLLIRVGERDAHVRALTPSTLKEHAHSGVALIKCDPGHERVNGFGGTFQQSSVVATVVQKSAGYVGAMIRRPSFWNKQADMSPRPCASTFADIEHRLNRHATSLQELICVNCVPLLAHEKVAAVPKYVRAAVKALHAYARRRGRVVDMAAREVRRINEC